MPPKTRSVQRDAGLEAAADQEGPPIRKPAVVKILDRSRIVRCIGHDEARPARTENAVGPMIRTGSRQSRRPPAARRAAIDTEDGMAPAIATRILGPDGPA